MWQDKSSTKNLLAAVLVASRLPRTPIAFIVDTSLPPNTAKVVIKLVKIVVKLVVKLP